MKAKLIVNGKEIEVEIPEDVAEQLTAPVKKTGYERVEEDEAYLFVDVNGELYEYDENHSVVDNNLFEIGNYYSDYTVATNNARADKLMRQLRRFAVEHREKRPNWNCRPTPKWSISFENDGLGLRVESVFLQQFGGIYFETVDEAKAAANEFRDELMWYFTEYKDSL